MDERLIESVKKFPCLWDTSSEFYKCNETKDAAWNLIINEVNIKDVTTAKYRWKQLRDNHRDALKRQNATRSGQARRQRKEWKYQNAMSFLLPYMCNRDRASNFESLEDSANENSNQPNFDDNSQESSGILPSTSNNLTSVNVSDDSTASGPIPSTSKKRKNDEILDILRKNQENRDLLRQERTEVKNMMGARDKYDEIDSFFLNLAASTKKLPYYLQLQIKKNCFNAVMTAEETNLQQSWYSPNNYGYSTSSTPTSGNINISNNTANSSHVEETEATTEHSSTFPQNDINISTATASDVPETQNTGRTGTPVVELTGSEETADQYVDNNINFNF
ncbi:uncharacterized protein LOC123722734 [Papilio machaon]|uniref:uncharacterized protein LOC123722734 n=1 Tax=Papilio machaon TaxID=76193 RepID=UPI0006EAD501|nr:uncharacterized protein LOC123722734 [Papilio machaon]